MFMPQLTPLHMNNLFVPLYHLFSLHCQNLLSREGIARLSGEHVHKAQG